MSKKRLILGEIGFLLLAVLMAATGLFYNQIVGHLVKATDPNSLGPDDVGKTFTFKCEPYFIDAGQEAMVIEYDSGDTGCGYYVSAPTGLKNALYSRCVDSEGTYQGILRQLDEDSREIGINALDEYYTVLSEYSDGMDYANDPELQQMVHESLADYRIEVV